MLVSYVAATSPADPDTQSDAAISTVVTIPAP
jgi:hypothetical protein